MFKITGCGWAQFEYEAIKAPISYLTDAPMDLLDAAIDFLKTGRIQSVSFDGEGVSNVLTFSNDGVYITKHAANVKAKELNIDTMRLIIEIFKDINGNIDDWTDKFYGALLMTSKERTLYSTALKTRCMQLFELLKERINFSREDY